MRRDQGLRGRAREWWFPSEHLVTDDRQRVDVGSGVEPLLTRQLFRRHVAERADANARRGKPLGGRLEARFLDRARDAEVSQHRVPFLQQDVRRLDVAVHDAAAVGQRERIGDLAQHTQRLVNREAVAALEAVTQ